MVAFGVAGCLLEKLRIPLAPFVIGFVLAPIGEEKMIAGLMSSGGSWLPLVTRPGAVLLLAASGLLLWWSLRQRRTMEALGPEGESA